MCTVREWTTPDTEISSGKRSLVREELPTYYINISQQKSAKLYNELQEKLLSPEKVQSSPFRLNEDRSMIFERIERNVCGIAPSPGLVCSSPVRQTGGGKSQVPTT